MAEYPLKKFIGQDGMAIDFNDVHAAILGMGILEPLSIGVGRSPDGNGMILTVHVQEKWAFLPLPLLNTDFSTFWSAGLAIMDNNAFGLNDKFVVEGTYGNTAWFASALYQYTPEREHFPGWYVMGMYGRQNEQDTDQHGRVLRKYGQDTIRGGLGIQYPITGLLSTSTSIYLEHQSLREFEDSPNDPGERGLSGRINPALEIGRNKWDGYLQSQQRAKLGYTFTLLSKADPADIHPLHTVSLRGVYEYSILPGFKAGLILPE
ncbi:hypothetical protein AGMMS49940_22690 [Spirochaetia bacterium]|nr:hypothetical protein AGMMS49940_22690 [Spirochaetia bacterium]